MKLMTKAIEKKARAQYPQGNDLESQKIAGQGKMETIHQAQLALPKAKGGA